LLGLTLVVAGVTLGQRSETVIPDGRYLVLSGGVALLVMVAVALIFRHPLEGPAFLAIF
jgi:hypothetical protein